MMGSFLTRGLQLVLGYTYPAYECFKTVEQNKPEIEQLRFWCQYWILVAVLTVFERIGDTFISWLPMYCEAKLAFFVYLWYPKTKGTSYIYDSFLRPYVAKHETDIDRKLLELRAKAGDIAVIYWQKATSYGQTRVFEIMQYAASQTPKPRPAQQQQKHAGVCEPPPPTTMTHQPQLPSAMRQPPAPATGSQQREPGKETGLTPGPPTAAAPAPAPVTEQATTTSQPTTVASEGQVMEIKSVPPILPNQSADSPPPPQETVIEETIRVTRGRLRKTRLASNR